jgi:outer membrane receptor for ferrienterochelin and colicin
MQKLAKMLVFACCFVFAIGELSAQEIKGKVKSESGAVVPFANVYWLNTTIGTTTSETGDFSIKKTDKSSRLVVSSVGFTSDTISVSTSTITIQLKNSVELGQVNIISRETGSSIGYMDSKKVEQVTQKELQKAACCNLSESFETLPSIDVAISDAVTGTKKIRMLGLEGPNTFISRESMPGVRGLGSAYGLTFIPGVWIHSMQLSKGVGSVINGYESIAGQINVELKKPEDDELFVNMYLNQSGRTELNFNQNYKVSDKWSTMLLLHGSARPFEVDNNDDGFMDFPTGNQINVMNRWKYYGTEGLEGQIGAWYINDQRVGGQTGYEPSIAQNLQPKYGLEINTERIEVFGKMGYVFGNKPYKSMGLQATVSQHKQTSNFGLNDYNAVQESGYLNYLYRTQIKSDKHVITTGASYVYDRFEETAYDSSYNRTEQVPGVYMEYTFAPNNNISVVGGLRADFNSIYGNYITPRIHARWAATEKLVFRGVAGSGQRTVNIFAENQGMFASSRTFQLLGNRTDLPFGLKQEKAYNFGLNFNKDFRLFYRDGYFGVDVYHTRFENQVIYDLEDARTVKFYNLDGESFATSIQAEVNFEVIKFVDLKVAYRYLDVKADYQSGMKQKPLTAAHRVFTSLGYTTRKNTKGGNWKFDGTVQYLGEQRIPSTAINALDNQRSTTSEGFVTANLQITKTFNKRWDVYAGMENITNYRQDNPIIDADNPLGTGSEFDSGLVWGPIFGRMVYAGFRFAISADKK